MSPALQIAKGTTQYALISASPDVSSAVVDHLLHSKIAVRAGSPHRHLFSNPRKAALRFRCSSRTNLMHVCGLHISHP